MYIYHMRKETWCSESSAVCLYLCVFFCRYIHIHTCIYIDTICSYRTGASVNRPFASTYMCVCVRIYICICIYIYTYIYMHIFIYIYRCAYTHIYIRYVHRDLALKIISSFLLVCCFTRCWRLLLLLHFLLKRWGKVNHTHTHSLSHSLYIFLVFCPGVYGPHTHTHTYISYSFSYVLLSMGRGLGG